MKKSTFNADYLRNIEITKNIKLIKEKYDEIKNSYYNISDKEFLSAADKEFLSAAEQEENLILIKNIILNVRLIY